MKAISNEARHAWNQMIGKLMIGKIVTLDHRDTAWLLEIGSKAVAWHEANLLPAPELATTETPTASKPPRKTKKTKAKENEQHAANV